MSGTTMVALALALVGLVLPAGATATLLAGGQAGPSGVVTGLWWFKGLLMLHAALLILAARWSRSSTRGRALVAPPPGAGAGTIPREVPVVALLLAIGLALRLYSLGSGLWFDEIQTLVDYVRLPLGRVLTTYDSQNQHLLYSLSAAGSVGVFGESAWALRLPAVIFGLASLWALYRFGLLVASRRETLLATAFLTLSYHHVWFSQNARGYTGLMLWTLVGTGCFLRLLEGRYRGRGCGTAVLYAASMAFAAYTHVTAVVIAAAHFLVWLAVFLRTRPEDRGFAARLPLAALVLSATLTLLLYAPVLPQVAATVTHPPKGAADTDWQSPVWFVTEALRGLSGGLPGGYVTLAAGATIVLAGVASYWKRSRVVLAAMLLPVLLTAGAVLGLRHNLWPRFFFFGAGFGVLILMRGGFAILERLWPVRGPQVATVGASLAIVASAMTVPRAWAPKQDFEGASRYVESRRAPDDAVVTVDLTRYPYSAYYREPFTAVDSAAALERIELAHRRTWVLYTFPIRLAAVQPRIWERLRQRYVRAAIFPGTVGGGAVVVMVFPSPS